MEQFPEHISNNLKKDKDYYSMDIEENLNRCKVDEEYFGEVLLANENLIWHSVHKYIGDPDVIVKSNGIDKDDILQLGRVGFIKSVMAFDVSRGVKFSSFSVTAIVREVRCFLRDSANIIRPTRTANELINKIVSIEKDLGRTPSVEELEILLDEPRDKIVKALVIGRGITYLDKQLSYNNNDMEGITILDTLESDVSLEDDVVNKVFLEYIINVVGDRLSPKEVEVFKHRLKGLNQTQTARKENISQMRVSRIMKKVARVMEEEGIVELLRESP